MFRLDALVLLRVNEAKAWGTSIYSFELLSVPKSTHNFVRFSVSDFLWHTFLALLNEIDLTCTLVLRSFHVSFVSDDSEVLVVEKFGCHGGFSIKWCNHPSRMNKQDEDGITFKKFLLLVLHAGYAGFHLGRGRGGAFAPPCLSLNPLPLEVGLAMHV